jgi:DNA polymerase-1
MEKKLFLLDAMALIYRAYFAFSNNPRINSKGLNTSAMLGFTNTLFEVLKTQKPTHIGIAFDTKAATQRHKDFEDYKANRQAMPEDLVTSLPYIDRIVDAFNIPKLVLDGYEADDIIGTLAKKAEKNGFKTFMMTPDKDYMQLVSENILMYKPARMGNKPEIIGIKEVQEKFGVETPEQVIDILGLWGDAVDNIPGIPGIGEKRAKDLVSKYGSIEGLIANTDELKGKMKENVVNFSEQGLLSKKLATILLDVPIDFNEEDLKYQEPDYDKLKAIFEELEFKTLAKRIFADLNSNAKTVETKSKSEKNDANSTLDMFAVLDESDPGSSGLTSLSVLADKNTNYQIVEQNHEIGRLINKLSDKKKVSIHLITTNTNPHQAELAGMALSFSDAEAYYIPFPEDYEAGVELLSLFKDFFHNKNIQLIGFDLKYITSVLLWYQMEVKNELFDVMLAHYLIEPDMKHDLSLLAEVFLNYKIIVSDELLGRKSEAYKRLKTIKYTFREVRTELTSEYACQRCDVLLKLQQILHKKLSETNTLSLYQDVEIPLLSVLAAIETQGVRLDVDAMNNYSLILGEKLKSLEQAIYEHAGHSFNIASPKQLGVVLFEELKIVEKPKLTKTKQYKTGEEILTKLKKKHPIIEFILEYRTLSKLKSTYVDSLPKLVNPRTGKIHTSYNQAVASTGRLSSNNPNLQNIPIRSSEGREIRKAFVASDENHTLLAADYSQIELRIIAHMSEDVNMLADFNSGKDIHTATAARVYNVAVEDVTKDMRSKAKSVNFGIIYGQSAFGLSENLGISRKEAKEIIDQYFVQYSGIKTYMDSQISFAKEHSYVETILKRRRYLRDINSSNAVVRSIAERNAINAPIQGSSADMIKIAMINIYKEMQKRNLKSQMILQVHDELIFDCLLSEQQELTELVVDLMRNAMPLKVPVVVDYNNGENWLDAH